MAPKEDDMTPIEPTIEVLSAYAFWPAHSNQYPPLAATSSAKVKTAFAQYKEVTTIEYLERVMG